MLTQVLKQRIASSLEHEKWSPKLISKRLALNGEYCVSNETIYKWIWNCKHTKHRNHRDYKNIHNYLRHNGRLQKRKKTSKTIAV